MFSLTLPFLYNIDVENGPPFFYFTGSSNYVKHWVVCTEVAEIRTQLPICANYISCSCIYLMHAAFVESVFYDYSCN